MATTATFGSGIIFGEDGKLRPIWRAVIFASLANWIAFPLLQYAVFLVIAVPTYRLAPGPVALNEILNFLTALICTAVFAIYEHRRIDAYGLPVGRALGLPTWEGALVGVAMAGAVALGIIALGGMQIHGLAINDGALAFFALAWLGTNICVGVAEEFFFRSYFLQTLWKSIGFWPASIVIAVLFAADHYFFKPGENVWDVITLVSISLMLCYSVLRTGALWFAVGFHIAFDYMQLFVIGTPNGTQIPKGRLLDVTFHGPAWLTGGVLGTEASFLMYPAIALAWFYIWWRYPRAGSGPARI
jgi:uncharacterized protein